TLQQLYGYADGDGMQDLRNVKAFARRLRITYQDVVDILKTRFINPNGWLIPKLSRLGVPFTILQKYKNGEMTDQDFDKSLAPGLDISQYGQDVHKWVKDNYSKFVGLLTLADPAKPG